MVTVSAVIFIAGAADDGDDGQRSKSYSILLNLMKSLFYQS